MLLIFCGGIFLAQAVMYITYIVTAIIFTRKEFVLLAAGDKAEIIGLLIFQILILIAAIILMVAGVRGMGTCDNCGERTAKRQRFCHWCGNKLRK